MELYAGPDIGSYYDKQKTLRQLQELAARPPYYQNLLAASPGLSRRLPFGAPLTSKSPARAVTGFIRELLSPKLTTRLRAAAFEYDYMVLLCRAGKIAHYTRPIKNHYGEARGRFIAITRSGTKLSPREAREFSRRVRALRLWYNNDICDYRAPTHQELNIEKSPSFLWFSKLHSPAHKRLLRAVRALRARRTGRYLVQAPAADVWGDVTERIIFTASKTVNIFARNLQEAQSFARHWRKFGQEVVITPHAPRPRAPHAG